MEFEENVVFYTKKSDPNYDRMIIQQDTSRPKSVMIWGSASTRGKATLRFVQLGAKIISNYYMNGILTTRCTSFIAKKRKKKMVSASRFSTKSYFKINNRIFE